MAFTLRLQSYAFFNQPTRTNNPNIQYHYGRLDAFGRIYNRVLEHVMTGDQLRDILITEFEGGRVIEIDADRRKVWEYVNRHDDRRVAEVTEARLYPSGAFTVADWSCP